MTMMKHACAILLIVFLFTVIPVCLPGCAAPRPQPLPPPQPAPVLPSTQAPRFSTAIYEGPSGTVNYNSFTFKWGSSLSSTDPRRYTYTSMLQGYDKDYSPFLPATERSYQGIPNGSYVFYVKAQDPTGNIEELPALRSFTISGVIPPQAAQNLPPVPGGGGGNLLIGSDVSRIAVGSDGLTLYALDSASARLYRSNTAGTDWRDISSSVGAPAPWVDLAVAPDDPAFIALAVSGGREVFVSADGGSSFNGTGLASVIGAGQAVTCLALSPGYGSPRREIAAGTANGSASGSVYINVLAGFSGGWANAGAGSPGWPAAGADVFAARYSPSFGSDGTLLLVASGAAGTYLYSGMRDVGSRSITWNSAPGYPVQVGSTGTPLLFAGISLPSDYDSGNPYSRRIFINWGKSSTGGVYYISDYQIYSLGVPEAISSIAYYGGGRGGKLLAGAARCQGGSGCYQVQTYFIANPVSNSAYWQPSQKAPTGSRAAMVAWSPDGLTAYAGTSGVESAFSHSLNNGATWNQ